MSNREGNHVGRPTEVKQFAHTPSAILLTEMDLDRVTGAGSKPGMVGDGRSAVQSALLER